jgi:hypothetical protein
MGKTIMVEDEDHKKFRRFAFDSNVPMNELFHQWVEQHIPSGGDVK